MLRIFSPAFSTSFFSPFLGLSPRMSGFLVLQFGMSAASVHCCYTVSPRIESCMLCDKFVHLSFYFQNLCSLPGMAVDSGRPDTIVFSLISFRSPSLGFELLRQCFFARKMLSCAVSFTNCVLRCRRLEGFGAWQPEISVTNWRTWEVKSLEEKVQRHERWGNPLLLLFQAFLVVVLGVVQILIYWYLLYGMFHLKCFASPDGLHIL